MTLFHPIWRFLPSNAPILALFSSGSALSFAAGSLLEIFLGASYLALGLFCFGLGAGLGISHAKSKGGAQFYLRHMKRLALLFAIGFALDFILTYGWNFHVLTILGSIALVGALALAFLALPEKFRLPVLLPLPFAYYPLHALPVPAFLGNDAIFHGAYGIFALASAAAFGALCGCALAGGKKPLAEITRLLLLAVALAISLALLFPLSDFERMAVAPGYAMATAVIGMVILLLAESRRIGVPAVELLGANALLVFVLEYFLVHYPWRIITNGEAYVGDPLAVLAFVLLVNAAYYFIVKFLSQRGMRLSV